MTSNRWGRLLWRLKQPKTITFRTEWKSSPCQNSSTMEKTSSKDPSSAASSSPTTKKPSASRHSNAWTYWTKRQLVNSTKSTHLKNRFHKRDFSNSIISRIQNLAHSCKRTSRQPKLKLRSHRSEQTCASNIMNRRGKKGPWMIRLEGGSELLITMVRLSQLKACPDRTISQHFQIS